MKEILIGDKIKKELESKTSFHGVLKSRYGKETPKPITGSFMEKNNHSVIPKKEK